MNPPTPDPDDDVAPRADASRAPLPAPRAKPVPVPGNESLAGKILHVFRLGGDSERSVGSQGAAPLVPEERRTGPAHGQALSDAQGPVVARTMADSRSSVQPDTGLPETTLKDGTTAAAAETAVEPAEPVRLQTIEIDLRERLARARAAQLDTLQQVADYQASGDDLGKAIDRKP